MEHLFSLPRRGHVASRVRSVYVRPARHCHVMSRAEVYFSFAPHAVATWRVELGKIFLFVSQALPRGAAMWL
eukprot:2853836-Pyramimonas_sp.AAC.1